MSTCNFSQPNLSKIYACECEEEWDWEDNIENVIYELGKIKGFHMYKEDKWLDNDTKIIGAFDFEFYDHYYKGWDTISIYVTVESGYYSGMKFDVDFNDLMEIEQTRALEKKIRQKCNAIEKALKTVTTPLVRVAVFSNGDAIYEKAY